MNLPDINLPEWFCFDFYKFFHDGFVIRYSMSAELLLTLRGVGLIDVFEMKKAIIQHIAFLDFDFTRPAALDSAFGSPFVGIPFNPLVHRSIGQNLPSFCDLRSKHHVGFFVLGAYRNKGAIGFWNLDELMMALAMRISFEMGQALFTIHPTKDKKPYYQRKYGAVLLPSRGDETILGIDIKTVWKKLSHISWGEKDGDTQRICAKCTQDAS